MMTVATIANKRPYNSCPLKINPPFFCEEGWNEGRMAVERERGGDEGKEVMSGVVDD